MKTTYRLLILTSTLLLAATCDTIPVTGKACYPTPNGTICVTGSKANGLEIDGTFRGQK